MGRIDNMGLAKNALANFAGRAWTALVGIAIIPVYIRYLGIEQYGLLGLYAALVGVIATLDLGLSTTINRLVAQRLRSPPDHPAHSLSNITGNFALAYATIGVVIGLIIVLTAPWHAANWLQDPKVAPATIENALRIMGVMIAFQWPAALFSGGLLGLQRHGPLNLVRVLAITVQAIGSVVVLEFVSTTIEALFIWISMAQLAQTIALSIVLSILLPHHHSTSFKFTPSLLLLDWRFSIGTAAVTSLATVLTQLDKIAVASLFSLETVGYYTLAFSISTAMLSVASPLYAAAFPRFSELAREMDDHSLAATYRKVAQVMGILIFPLGTSISVFAPTILETWTGDWGVANNTAPIVSVVMVGTMLNCVMLLPFALQLSHGWTSLSIYKNLVAVALFLPALISLTSLFGVIGAASLWALLNLGYLAVEVPLMHRRLLTDRMTSWYLEGVILPALVSGAVTGGVWLLGPDGVIGFATPIMTTAASCAVLFFISPIRSDAIALLRSRIKGT